MTKKFMQLPDAVMRSYYELLTDAPLPEIDALLAGHPKQAKVELGRRVVGGYHSAAAAEDAARRWQREIGEGALPTEIEQRVIHPGGADSAAPGASFPRNDSGEPLVAAVDLLAWAGLVTSRSEARRLIQGGGVSVGDPPRRVAAHDELVAISPGLIVRAGKKKIVRVQVDE
jgi:tyrosyl-tRNA synthetase